MTGPSIEGSRHPFLRGLTCLALTIGVTAVVPWIFLPRTADWAGLGIPQVVVAMAALAFVSAIPLALAGLVEALRARPNVAQVVLVAAPEIRGDASSPDGRT